MPVETDLFFSLLALLFTHRAGSHRHKHEHKKMEKVPFLVFKLMIMSILKCEPAHNRYNALVTYMYLVLHVVYTMLMQARRSERMNVM